MQKSVLAFAGLAAIASITIVLFQAPSDTTEQQDSPTPAIESGSGSGARSDTDAGTRPSSDASLSEVASPDTERAQDTTVAREVDLGTDRVATDLGSTIHCRVVLPPGTPTDDEVLVAVHRVQPPSRSRTSIIGVLDLDHGQGEIDVTHFPLGPDGTAEIRLPYGDVAWVSLESRFLALDEALRIDGEAEECVIEPRLGAYISGRIELPPGLDPESVTVDDIDAIRYEIDPMQFAGLSGASKLDDYTSPSFATLSDDWTYEIRAVLGETSGALKLETERFAAQQIKGVAIAPGVEIRVDFQLTEGVTVGGTVVDSDGQPVAGAELSVEIDPLMFGQGGFEVREGVSSVDGSFVMEHVATGDLRVAAEADGLIAAAETLEATEGRDYTDLRIELSSGNSIAGTLKRPNGDPVADCEIDVEFDFSYAGGMEGMNTLRGADGRTRTDAEGVFRVTGLGKGPFVVSASMTSDDGRTWRAREGSIAPNTSGLELIVQPPLGVSGVVVNDLGEVLTDFRVTARVKTAGMLQGLGAESHDDSFEDPEGHFFLDGLRAGEWELLAGAEGHARPDPVTVELPRSMDDPVVLTIARAASASGVVLDPAGLPLPEATVALKPSLADIGRIALDGLPPSTETDESGYFELDGLPPGEVQLAASAMGYGPSEIVSIEVAPGEGHTNLILTVRAGGRILCTVLDDEGEPFPSQTVLAQNPSDLTGQKFATTDADGEAVFTDLAPGNYQVMTFGGMALDDDSDDPSAMLAGMKFTMAEVKEGEDTEVVLGSLPEDPVAVSGVVSASGAPVQGATVTFIADDGAGLEQLEFAMTDEGGRYSAELSAPGRYLINVQKISGTGQQQTIELLGEIPETASYSFDVDLPVGVIAGRVYGPDGEPAGGVRITLGVDGPIRNGSFSGGQYAETDTETDGTYRLEWLRPGEYSVAAGGAMLGGLLGDTGQDPLGRQVRSGIRISEGQTLNGVDFRLEDGGKVSGRVIDADGSAVVGAAIFLRDEQGSLVDRISMIQTGPSGSFAYTGLNPGKYTVSARTTDAVSIDGVEVQVRSGETSETELRLAPGTVFTISLADEDGNPVDCSVSVTGPDGQQVNGSYSYGDLMRMFTEGDFSTTQQTVGPVPPGRYTIRATTADGRSAKRSRSVNGEPRARVRLKLD